MFSQLQADKAAAAGRQTVRKRRERDDPVTSAAKLRKTILSMLARGQVGRICSNEVASLEDPAVREALQAKYKARIKDLPSSVTKGECVQSLGGLRDSKYRRQKFLVGQVYFHLRLLLA